MELRTGRGGWCLEGQRRCTIMTSRTLLPCTTKNEPAVWAVCQGNHDTMHASKLSHESVIDYRRVYIVQGWISLWRDTLFTRVFPYKTPGTWPHPPFKIPSQIKFKLIHSSIIQATTDSTKQSILRPNISHLCWVEFQLTSNALVGHPRFNHSISLLQDVILLQLKGLQNCMHYFLLLDGVFFNWVCGDCQTVHVFGELAWSMDCLEVSEDRVEKHILKVLLNVTLKAMYVCNFWHFYNNINKTQSSLFFF